MTDAAAKFCRTDVEHHTTVRSWGTSHCRCAHGVTIEYGAGFVGSDHIPLWWMDNLSLHESEEFDARWTALCDLARYVASGTARRDSWDELVNVLFMSAGDAEQFVKQLSDVEIAAVSVRPREPGGLHGPECGCVVVHVNLHLDVPGAVQNAEVDRRIL